MCQEAAGALEYTFFNDESDSDSSISRSRDRQRGFCSASTNLEHLKQFSTLDSSSAQQLPVFTRLTQDIHQNLGLMWRSTGGSNKALEVLPCKVIIARLKIR